MDIRQILLYNQRACSAMLPNRITPLIMAAGLPSHITGTECNAATQLHIVRILLDSRARPDVQAGLTHKRTALHDACEYGFGGGAAVVSALLEARADANARSSTGMVPLHYAAVGQYAGDVTDTVRLLLLHRADPNIVHPQSRQHPLTEFAEVPDIVALLLDNGAVQDASTGASHGLQEQDTAVKSPDSAILPSDPPGS